MPDSKYDPPNLDLIGMVQRARMQHDADAQPSQIHAVYWIEAKRAADDPPPTARAGQWIITTTVGEVDVLWAAIKIATEAGQLGYKSKVSTAPRSGAKDSVERVIYVCTVDADDSADVERVHAALRTLGVVGDISYERIANSAELTG